MTKLHGIVLLLFLLASIAPPARAQTPQDSNGEAEREAFAPNDNPTLRVERAGGPIEVDGELDDAGWTGAARAENFVEHFPNEGEKPPVESEVLVTYDSDNLYLAFLARDDPSSLRATLRDRDELWSDDYFGILLDTYGDASWAYFLFANPLGVQGDTRFSSNGGEDESFDIIYQAEAKITENGYQIEMAIPFKSLRFPNRSQHEWKVNFWRTRPRDSRAQHSWALIDRDDPCFLCQFGTLTGIQGVKPGGALELMPAAVASQSGGLRDFDDPGSEFRNADVDGELSLFARYPFSSGLTAEAALNPDFSQVESDVAQIDVNTTFALFFPERRPFFQEGSDLFDTYFDVVYTRQINDPIVTGKFIGRQGRTSVAYLGGVDNRSPILLPFEERSFIGEAGSSLSNIVRLQQTLLRNSYIGAIVTDRRLQNSRGSGTTGGVDGRLRVGQYSLEYQVLASHTQEPDEGSLTEGLDGVMFDDGERTAAFDGESFWGHAEYFSFERDARTWVFDFDYWASSPTFRADLGFETQNAYRRTSMFQGLIFYPEISFVDQLFPRLFVSRQWNSAGVRKDDVISPGISLTLKGDTRVIIERNWSRERFAGIEFDNLNNWFFLARSSFSELFRPGFWVSHGRRIARRADPPVPGTGTTAEVWFDLQPLTRWAIEPELQYSRLEDLETGEEFFDGYILRVRTAFQFTREIFLRLVVQYNDFSSSLSVEPLLTYRLNPFTLFFVGSNAAYRDYDSADGLTQTSRQFFAKFQYLFRS